MTTPPRAAPAHGQSPARSRPPPGIRAPADGVSYGCTGSGAGPRCSRRDLRERLTRRAPSFIHTAQVGASHDPPVAVGLIGLGNMGTAVAERLLDGGYELVVANPSPAKRQALAPPGG